MNFKDKVIDNVFLLMDQKDLKAEHVAQRGGFAKSLMTYMKKKKERSNTSIEMIGRIAKGIGVPPWYFFVDKRVLEGRHPESIVEFCELYSDLSEQSQDKVLQYMQDLKAAQQAR